MNLRNHSLSIKPRAVKTYLCPPASFDTDDCSGAYDEAGDAVTPAAGKEWADVKEAAQLAINAYIDECHTSSCQSDCSTLINGNSLANAITKAGLEVCAKKAEENTPILGSTVCTTEASDNEETCKDAYDALVAVSDAKKTWVSATILSSLAAYVTACTKTACFAACKSEISGVNVALPYTNLLLSLNDKCNPYPPTPTPEGDNAFMTIEHSLNIFFILLSLIGIELITFF
jgi:hypothetical protein